MLFQDTEGTFRPERIMEIAERFGGPFHVPMMNLSMLIIPVDPDQACENIAYARAQNSEVGSIFFFFFHNYLSLTITDANRTP